MPATMMRGCPACEPPGGVVPASAAGVSAVLWSETLMRFTICSLWSPVKGQSRAVFGYHFAVDADP